MSDDATLIPPPMSDDTTLIPPPVPLAVLTPPTPPAPGVTMSTPTKLRPRPKRNAKPRHPPPRHPPPRHRNAAPPASRPSAPRSKGAPEPTKKDSFVQLLQTLGGAAATSVVGAYAVKWGLHPELVSAGLGITGGYFAWQSTDKLKRQVGAGAASAAGSQLLLLKLNPAPETKATTPATPTAPAQIVQPPRPKNADLGSLPPGMLDAAFERARAELAVASDGYPPGYEHAHHQFHHETVP
jgi:hypothetical protein